MEKLQTPTKAGGKAKIGEPSCSSYGSCKECELWRGKYLEAMEARTNLIEQHAKEKEEWQGKVAEAYRQGIKDITRPKASPQQ